MSVLYHPNAGRHACPQGESCWTCGLTELASAFTSLADALEVTGGVLRRLAVRDEPRNRAGKSWQQVGPRRLRSIRHARPRTLPEPTPIRGEGEVER